MCIEMSNIVLYCIAFGLIKAPLAVVTIRQCYLAHQGNKQVLTL